MCPNLNLIGLKGENEAMRLAGLNSVYPPRETPLDIILKNVMIVKG